MLSSCCVLEEQDYTGDQCWSLFEVGWHELEEFRKVGLHAAGGTCSFISLSWLFCPCVHTGFLCYQRWKPSVAWLEHVTHLLVQGLFQGTCPIYPGHCGPQSTLSQATKVPGHAMENPGLPLCVQSAQETQSPLNIRINPSDLSHLCFNMLIQEHVVEVPGYSLILIEVFLPWQILYNTSKLAESIAAEARSQVGQICRVNVRSHIYVLPPNTWTILSTEVTLYTTVIQGGTALPLYPSSNNHSNSVGESQRGECGQLLLVTDSEHRSHPRSHYLSSTKWCIQAAPEELVRMFHGNREQGFVL